MYGYAMTATVSTTKYWKLSNLGKAITQEKLVVLNEFQSKTSPLSHFKIP